jgi:MFS transporter, PAT family, beta-lactamase induction signal transducer AmpG
VNWTEAVKVYGRPRVRSMVFLGFSAGLPYLLVFSTLTAWLRDEEISRSAIGFFAWVGMIYSIKVFWAPVVDGVKLPLLQPLLGQRRSWILLAQIGIALGLWGMTLAGPESLLILSIVALIVAFSSATQDIAIDAFRIESVESTVQGAMSAAYILGYRVALLVAGAGALYLAEYYDWVTAYQLMACLMMIGMITILLVAEPDKEPSTNTASEMVNSDIALKDPTRKTKWQGFLISYWDPVRDFFRTNGRFALFLLLLIGCYRLSDIAMGIMANPFYLDLGYSKVEIANIAKVFGFAMSISGSALGGVLVLKWGILKPLLLGAVLVAVTNLLFAGLALIEPDLIHLAIVISADNLSGGLAATAFIAYLSSLTNTAYTATQYALFSSLMTLPGKFVSGFSGMIVDASGYAVFFASAALIGLPAIIMVSILVRRERLTSV